MSNIRWYQELTVEDIRMRDIVNVIASNVEFLLDAIVTMCMGAKNLEDFEVEGYRLYDFFASNSKTPYFKVRLRDEQQGCSVIFQEDRVKLKDLSGYLMYTTLEDCNGINFDRGAIDRYFLALKLSR